MDIFQPEQRHKIMSAIKGRDTKPEISIRKLLYSLGYRFRLQRKDLPGKPDIVLPKYKVAIFINGCFWHQHKNCKIAHFPASNRDFWERKLNRNAERDRKNYALLREMGWRVIVIWECEIKTILQTRQVPGLPPKEAKPYAETADDADDDGALMAAEEPGDMP